MFRTLASTAITIALLGSVAELSAHGGVYRGPGDFVPPGQGSGSGKTGGPGTPSTPTPGIPTPGNPTPGTGGGISTPTGGLPGNGGSRGGATTSGGYQLGADLSRWEFWWELNKDPFLELKRRIHDSQPSTGPDDFIMGPGQKRNRTASLAPTAADKQIILALLEKLLQDPASNRDIVSSCLMALAKIGGDTSVIPMFARFLSDADQEKRETAALALGITALKEAVPDLCALALDDEDGRRLVGGGRVDYRTRSFALYGLGLVAHGNHDLRLQARVFELARKILETTDGVRRDEQVAALQAIRLLALGDPAAEERRLRTEVLDWLVGYFNRKDRQLDLVRSHALTALAAQCQADDPQRTELLELMVARAQDRHEKSWIHQSAVMALGKLAEPEDAAVSVALRRYFQGGKDASARGFAAIALGEIGGESNREFLYKALRAERTKDMDKPWLGFGLAVLDSRAREAAPGRSPDRTSAEAVLAEFRSMRNRSFQAGLALALGILRHLDSSADIEKALADTNEDEPKGYFCVALGLLGSHDSKDLLVSVLDGAVRRDTLLTQAAIGLGLLGDKEVVRKLTERLEQDNVVAVYSAISTALGWIGDRTSVAPLIGLAEDASRKDLPRAFACVALGLVADKEPLPWNSKIAVGANYRASVETLSGAGNGILDIL